MDYIKITFAELQPEQKEILIAQLAEASYEVIEEKENSLDEFINKNDIETKVNNEIYYK